MEEKIRTTKLAILNRIEKVVNDETKSLSAESLTAMANIVSSFDSQEIYKKEPKYNMAELLKKWLDTVEEEKEISHIDDKGEL